MITHRSPPLNPAFDGPDRVLYHGAGRSGTGGRLPLAAGGKSELHRAACWITSSRGDSKESATENTPPKRLRVPVRVKRCGKSAPGRR